MAQNTLVRTAYDLERKYDLSSIVGLKKAVQQSTTSLTKVENELNNFVIKTATDIKELQSQVDGNVTTWFFYGVPTLKNQPATDWGTSEFPNHVGDLYYDKDTGYCYKFVFENNTYSWVRQEDTAITEVLAISNAAQDTADSKRRVFVVQPKPPYDAGDLWIVESGEHQGELFRCWLSKNEEETFEADDWIVATKYTDDTVANSVQSQLDDFEALVVKDYVTNKTFSETTEGFNMSVQSVRVLANEKAKVFKSTEEQPIPQPPYNIGDVFIDGTNIYTCIVAKTETEEGEFGTDWELNLNGSDYSTKAEFEILDDKIKTEVSSVTDKLNEQGDVIGTIERNITQIQTDTYTKTEINTKLSDGSVTKVKTNSATFDDEGMHYESEQAKTSSTINHIGVSVKEGKANELLFAGYVDKEKGEQNPKLKDFEGQTVVYSKNSIVENYFIIGSNSRIEDYTEEVGGKTRNGTGIFIL